MNMSSMNSKRLQAGLFSARWAELLCLCWNENPDWHNSMASAGEIGFVLELSDELRTLVLCWDEDGRIDTSRLPQAAQRPEFRGGLEPWSAVMRGEMSPTSAVLRGHLVYRGPFWFAAKYANAFTHIVRAQHLALAHSPLTGMTQCPAPPSPFEDSHE